MSASILPAWAAISTLSRSSSVRSDIDSEKDFIPSPNDASLPPNSSIEPIPKRLAIPSITDATVIAIINSAKLCAAAAVSGDISLRKVINGKAAIANADNCRPKTAKFNPRKLPTAVISSATVNAIIATTRFLTPDNTFSSTFLMPAIK